MKIKRRSRVGLLALAVIMTSFGVAAAARADATAGSLAGNITEHDGTPASGLLFVSNLDGTVFRYTSPDSTGFYAIGDLPAGEYTADFTTNWGGRASIQPHPIVTAGAQTTADLVLPATGALAGRFTGQDGSGIADVRVSAGDVSTQTAADGSWSIGKAFVGDGYTVEFTHYGLGIDQFAYGKSLAAQADPISVRAGETTTVNDVLLPTGSVRVTARDAVTGQAIGEFGAHIHTRSGQTTSGELVLTDVPIGTHDLTVGAPGYLGTAVVAVTVVAGQQVQAVVTLTPEAKIAATVVDAGTGSPLPDMCVVPALGADIGGCDALSDADGHVVIAGLAAGTYQLFAVQASIDCECAIYGAQWVGARGGTGKRQFAASIAVSAGQTVTAPVVKMDRAGTITGRVTRPDGTPATGTVGLLPAAGTPEGAPIGAAAIGEDGRYSLTFAGPYEWALFFDADGEAPQFAGGTANRYLATKVMVRSQSTTGYDFQLHSGVGVTVIVTGLAQATAGARVQAFNAITGDYIAEGQLDGTGRATFPVIGSQFVRFQVEASRSPGLFWIPAQGTKSFTLAF